MDFYSILKSVVLREKNKSELNGVIFYVIRSDGSVVYTEGERQSDQTIGALVCGAWQATSALLKKEDEDFRFSFDTSSSGVYVLSLRLNGEVLYLVSMFDNEINPGRLKVKIKKIRDALCEQLDGFSIKDTLQKDSLLFEDLSDEEVGNLFPFGDQ